MKRQFFLLVAFAGAAAVAFADADLEKEFDEAVKSGHPLAAERAFKKLSEERRDLSPNRYFEAAEVSRELGNDVDRRTRLSHFIKVSKAWNDAVEQAAWELCLNSDDPDAFVLLAEKSAGSRRVYDNAMRLLEGFRKQKRAADFLKVADAALAAFKADEDRTEILARVVAMETEVGLGLSDEDLRDFFGRNVCRDLSVLNPVFNSRGDAFPKSWRIDLSCSTGALLSPETLTWIAKVGTNKAERADAVRLFRKFEPLVFDGRHGRHACVMTKMHVELAPELLPAGAEAVSAAICADIDKVVASDGIVTNEVVRLMLHCANYAWTPADVAKMREKYAVFVSPGDMPGLFRLAEACEKANSTKPYHDILPRCSDESWVRYAMMPTFAKLGDDKELRKAFVEQMLFGDPDPNHVLSSIAASKMSDREKVALLETAYAKSGANSFWQWCVEHKRAAKSPVFASQLAKGFLSKVKTDAKSNVRLVEIRREMNALKRGSGNKAPEVAHKLFEEACREFKGQWPQPNKWESRVFRSIVRKYVDLCQHDGAAAPIAIKAIADKLDPKDDNAWREANVFDLVTNSIGERNALLDVARIRQKAAYITEVRLDKGTERLPVPVEAFAKVDPGAVIGFIDRNWHKDNPDERRLTPELAASLVAVVMKNFDCGKLGPGKAHGKLFPVAMSIVRTSPQLASAFPLDKVAGEVLDPALEAGRPAQAFLALAAACGRTDAYLNKYMSALSKVDPPTRLGSLVAICENPDVATFGNAEKGTIRR